MRTYDEIDVNKKDATHCCDRSVDPVESWDSALGETAMEVEGNLSTTPSTNQLRYGESRPEGYQYWAVPH